jgi:hypothetical protein
MKMKRKNALSLTEGTTILREGFFMREFLPIIRLAGRDDGER